ncbi:NUMOD4 domain-containing protein [Chryseobacterium sp. C-204]|uniref:NUMOD4 domain-containing protein n=1 Tax=Chryseobacterium sp. C-204 TaxID=2738985 RepID=UPI00293B8B28|nr:NUMOD4 domain-containing protein [Chryseobacterium sp. C-204]
MTDEQWKPIPGFDNRLVVSNKGRVKRLSGWTSEGRKIFLKEQILSQIMSINSSRSYSLYCVLRHKRKNTCLTITKLLYNCFVEKFDLNDNTIIVANNNNPLWNIEVSNLSLRPIYDVLKGKQTIIKPK